MVEHPEQVELLLVEVLEALVVPLAEVPEEQLELEALQAQVVLELLPRVLLEQ